MIQFISNIFGAVKDFVITIKEVIVAGMEIVDIVFSFLPSPFKEITLVFIVLVIGIIIYKVVRN